MGSIGEVVELSDSEAACLNAVREGHGTKTKIAVRAVRDFRAVTKALESLRRARLIRKGRDARWHVTPQGRQCSVRRYPDPKPKRGRKADGKVVPGSSADRLLKALDRPMRGTELTALLGVSVQRVHQLVVRLLAQDKIRIGDSSHILHIVARANDPSVLLTRDEERVLSALPDDMKATATGLAAVTHMPVLGVEELLARLCDLGLVENTGTRRGKELYMLSSAGRQHFQRREDARRAKPALLRVKSDRVYDVLSHLSDNGQARIKDVRDALGIAPASINALMQYLKRKQLVRKIGEELGSAYELTDDGRAALAEMVQSKRNSDRA